MKNSILFQRLEAAALLLATVYFYAQLRGNWLLFVVVWLVLDLSMAGYVLGDKVGAYVYNAAHSFVIPAALAVSGSFTHRHGFFIVALIWCAHITLDRLLGYGLKDETGFSHTHLGLIGPEAKRRR